MSDEQLTTSLIAWDTFCDELKKSGRSLLQQSKGLDTVTQADGLRYLTRLLRGGIEKFIEYDNPLDPVLYKVYHERLKWGGDNPDSIYSMSSISGDRQYLVRGNRGSIAYFNFSSMKMSVDGKLSTTGFINYEDLQCNEAGDFTLLVSATPPEQLSGEHTNWLATETDSNCIMIRQTFIDRSNENELAASIELIGGVDNQQGLDINKLTNGLQKAQDFFHNTGNTFVQLSQTMHQSVNQLPAVDVDYIKSMGGDPNYHYFWSAFEINQDNALLVHLATVPECDTWSLCLHNYWLESLDYHKSRIILNKHTAKQNSDGSVTLVISLQDPSVDNWLDSCGHTLGQMIFRWTKAQEVVAPQVELVNINTVDWSKKFQRW